MTQLSDFAKLAETLLPAVLAAGALEMRRYGEGVAVEEKADTSPVTVADREAEALILDGLWHAARGVPVVAEESASLGNIPPPGTAFFLVDPLDGTREFVNRCGEFTINVGLVVKGAPVFGMIYAPALGALYVTIGKGRAVAANIPVHMTDATLRASALIDMRTRAPDQGALTVIESRSHRSPATDAFLAGYAVAEEMRAGSSLKFCRIAEGGADLYVRLGPTKEWDTAAGQAILEAAGGTVTDLDGRRLVYGKAEDDYFNPHFVAWGGKPVAPRRA